MMYEMMKKHLEVCTAVNECRRHDLNIIKRHSVDMLQAFFAEVKELGLEEQIKQLSSAETDKLVDDCGFCQEIQWLLESGVLFDRIRGFLLHYPEKNLSACDYSSLKEALEDMDIPTDHIYDYWAYYQYYHLGKEQKKDLSDGMWFLRRGSDMMISNLSEKQRRLLWEPCFCQQFFDTHINISDLLVQMENAALVNLLNRLYEWSDGCADINGAELAQLGKAASEILAYLELVMDRIDKEDRGSFLVNWLENGNLEFDIKKLARMDAEKLKNAAESRVSYIGSIYGTNLAGIELESLDEQKERLLIYAITHQKRHFLSFVRGHSQLFCSIPWNSILFQPEFYGHVNINTLNEADLVECSKYMRLALPDRDVLTREYTFEEMKCLLGQDRKYHVLYSYLDYPRVDDRLRVFREIKKKQCIPENCEENDLKALGLYLSKKSLSCWMHEDFAQINGLDPENCVQILIHEELLSPYLADIRNIYQLQCLLRNRDKLGSFSNLKEFETHICENDTAWLELRREFKLSDEFVEKNKDNIFTFLYQNGAGIISDFCKENNSCKESARRLLVAELMGRFHELKYHKDDLSKEIDFPVSPEQKLQWMKNESSNDNEGFRIWEEDGLLPVIQIGEVPTHTCLSYKSGGWKDCLLSCFDTNKKIIFASKGPKVVFRAILRFTKGKAGTYEELEQKKRKTDVEFLDLTAEESDVKNEQRGEHLILFLERAYYCSLSPENTYHLMRNVVEFAYRKAKKLDAKFVVSDDYRMLNSIQDEYITSKYHIYISKSKNGRQYLDSVGGSASIEDSGSYRYGTFFTRAEEMETRTKVPTI